uniref:Carbonic anhydrase n=1 Tax=Hucho hucho TaxID=62062 RepID=A0A4W5K795_9TELE
MILVVVRIDDTTWSTIVTEHCNGSRQSPINIVSASAVGNETLTAFTFTKYGDNSTMKNIKNTGKTVMVMLTSGVQVTGGALSEAYDSLQFHLHWGNGTSVPGSEHTVDGTRYPMELHIVNAKSSLIGNTTAAVADGTGLFHLSLRPDEYINITHDAISLDEFLEGVDRTKYYRYLGSLTTPNCNEAVVWTVFKDPIKVRQDLVIHIDHNSTSDLMTNVFRNIQPDNNWVVTTQGRPASGASTMCSSLGPMALA